MRFLFDPESLDFHPDYIIDSRVPAFDSELTSYQRVGSPLFASLSRRSRAKGISRRPVQNFQTTQVAGLCI